ncbi:MAG: DUF2924 domain-containing protein [Hyphomicrobiales bacterium]|nr:MAG: DUF2924 domain-containing protein [Hyphomicrobiales bacterium]
MKHLTKEGVEREIAALDGLDIKALQNRWRELYKLPPPFKIRSGFLRRAIAYRLQELLYGGLSNATKKELRRIAEASRVNRSYSGGRRPKDGSTAAVALIPRRRVLSPGTRLLREWNGTTELVDVLTDSFGWRGKTYRTLSAVAVAITGTKWSGPKFFGLVDAKKAKANTARGASSAEVTQ